MYTFTILETESGLRLDKFLAGKGIVSRTRLQVLLKDGYVLINNTIANQPAYKVKEGDQISFTVPEAEPAIPLPQSIVLDILYEDDDLLVINKAAGMVVHPAPGHYSDTLVNALLAHCGNSLSGIGGVKRPGIVHRLDKDTSGLMVVAKNDKAHHSLSSQFTDRTLSRLYKALVWGRPSPQKGIIHTQIGRSMRNRQKMAVLNKGGKEAITHYTLLKSSPATPTVSLVECRLKTGRTHQIRVHMAHIGCPLVGDKTYGKRPSDIQNAPLILQEFPRQALHAYVITFRHPTSQQILEFSADLPIDMTDVIMSLNFT